MIRIIFFIILTYSNSIWSQEFKTLNQPIVVSNREVIKTIDSIRFLSILFEDTNSKNAEQTLINNHDIKELHLSNPPRSFILKLSNLGLNQLKTLLIEEYNDTTLYFNPLSIGLLYIRSKVIKEIYLKNLDTSSLNIVNIETQNLIKWETHSSYPNLKLLSLNAPLLNSFSIIDMPSIGNLSLNYSLTEIPKNLCNCPNLKLISLQNNRNIKVSKCVKQKVKNSVFSYIMIKDSMDGKIIRLIQSSDFKTLNLK